MDTVRAIPRGRKCPAIGEPASDTTEKRRKGKKRKRERKKERKRRETRWRRLVEEGWGWGERKIEKAISRAIFLGSCP